MYAVFYLHLSTILLITANWLIGGVSLLARTLVVARLKKEEALTIEKFGDEYRTYMERTGRFLPRIKARTEFERKLTGSAG